MKVEEEEGTTGEADPPLKTPGAGIKSTKEEEVQAVTGAEAAVPKPRNTVSTHLEMTNKSGRESTKKATLRTLEDDGTVEYI